MHADFTVELGRDDDCLEVPWASPDGQQHYFNLKSQPELLLNVAEAHHNRELAEFLTTVNSAHSALETAKCDTWLSDSMDEEDAAFGTAWKYGSYVDLIFTDIAQRMALEKHESFTQSISKLLHKAPEISAAAEFVVRRCYFHLTDDMENSEDGFCVTFYLHGYGDDEDDAKKRWVIGLNLVQNALLQITARERMHRT